MIYSKQSHTEQSFPNNNIGLFYDGGQVVGANLNAAILDSSKQRNDIISLDNN